MTWSVYILECSDGTLYTGITTDIERRVDAHNKGLGARYTRAKRPVKIVYSEASENRSSASIRECEIKKLTRLQKQILIKNWMPAM